MPGQGMTTLPPTKSIQSYLTTCGLQNSSNPELIPFWQGKNVSALSPCSGLIILARTCMSHDAIPQENMPHRSVLVGLGTHHEFQNELMSTEVPLYFLLSVAQLHLRFLFWIVYRNYIEEKSLSKNIWWDLHIVLPFVLLEQSLVLSPNQLIWQNSTRKYKHTLAVALAP